MKILTNTFGCQIGCFPFTYLGLPMELTKPKVEDLLSLKEGSYQHRTFSHWLEELK
jgi:hypothetical protein